jgi:spartin
MSVSKPSQTQNPLYPQVILSNPEAKSPFSTNPTSSSSLYPSIDVNGLAEKLFPAEEDAVSGTSSSLQSAEEVLVRVPGVLVHLIEKDRSVELASGELAIVGLRQGDNVVAVLARVGDEVQWPLAKDEAAVKLDEAHYFFSLRVPATGSVGNGEDDEDFGSKECEMLNYGLTIASKGQEALLEELDRVLEKYSFFSVQKVGEFGKWEVLDGSVAREMSPGELESDEKKELMGKSSAAYWTTLAPNVEDYSSGVAKLIAAGSGQMIRGILWCGDVTVDRLKWGNEFLKKRMNQSFNSEISPEAMRRMKRFEFNL